MGRRRPALEAAVWFGVGIALGDAWALPTVVLAASTAASFSLLLAGSIRRWGGRWMGWNICFLLCSAGMMRYEMVASLLPPDHVVHLIDPRGEVEIIGEVSREPEWVGDDLRVVLDVKRFLLGPERLSVCGAVLIRFQEHTSEIEYGDSLHLRIRLRRPEPARNPGGFDYRRYLERKGIYGTGKVRHAAQIVGIRPGNRNGFWKQLILPVRRSVRRSIDKNLSGAPAGLLKGLLLGEKRSVPEEVREAFARSGVNHVLAVSGLHVGLVAASIFFGLRCLGLGRRWTGMMTVTGVLMYALVTGLRPSVLRASIMGSLIVPGGTERPGRGRAQHIGCRWARLALLSAARPLRRRLPTFVRGYCSHPRILPEDSGLGTRG